MRASLCNVLKSVSLGTKWCSERVNIADTDWKRKDSLQVVLTAVHRTTMLSSLIVALLVCASVNVQAQFQPEQIHISMAGKTGMRVAWFTNQTTKSIVNYGVSGTDEYSTVGSEETYLENGGSHHVALLNNLKSNTRYFYTVGDGTAMSETFQFTTQPELSVSCDINLAVFGDMGYLDSVARPVGVLGTLTMAGNWSAVFSRDTLEKWKNNGEIDMVWHVGDVGYADDAVFHSLKTLVQFEYENAYNGYMNWIQNVTSVLPYHVLPGNHESECHDPACVVNPRTLGLPLSNFTAFNARWKMPSPESGGVESMWYSFDYGAVHFVSINTETDFPDAPEAEKGDSGIFDAGHFAPDGAYLAWLETDLQTASQDPATRWILAAGHRPFTDFNSADVDALFVKYNVSVYFAGHSHSYSRFPASDHSGVTTHITVGGAGCDEMMYAVDNPQPGLHSGVSCERWAEYQFPPQNLKKNKLSACQGAAFFTDAYAIGKLTVEDFGRGDLHWQLVSSIDGSVLDSITLHH